MGFLDWLGFAPPETKTAPIGGDTIPTRTLEEVRDDIRNGQEGANSTEVAAVVACGRVISEGLALPPCSVVQTSATGGRIQAVKHPLFDLLSSSGKGPNKRQTSFQFREQIGLHLALTGNAFVYVVRSPLRDRSIKELLPIDPGAVTVQLDRDLTTPLAYRVNGTLFSADDIWHLKGPAWHSHEGIDALKQARHAIGLACATEQYGANLFKNAARPGGLVSLKSTVSVDELAKIRLAWAERYKGVANAHSTAFIPAELDYKELAHSANDAQWIESRRFQIEEICRYFRVSPTKVFQSLGSQSYASVEQAHIAHDQDTDAPWHERFVQSANKSLFTDAERAAGYRVTLDNRAALRGTAVERMTYYGAGIANGIFTRNEAREMEGFDRVDDPAADELTPAANLFGPSGPSDAPAA